MVPLRRTVLEWCSLGERYNGITEEKGTMVHLRRTVQVVVFHRLIKKKPGKTAAEIWKKHISSKSDKNITPRATRVQMVTATHDEAN